MTRSLPTPPNGVTMASAPQPAWKVVELEAEEALGEHRQEDEASRKRRLAIESGQG